MKKRKIGILCALISASTLLNVNVADASEIISSDAKVVNEAIVNEDTDENRENLDKVNEEALEVTSDQDIDNSNAGAKEEVKPSEVQNKENEPLVYYDDRPLDELLPLFEDDYENSEIYIKLNQEVNTKENEVKEKIEKSPSYILKNDTVYQVLDGKESKAKNTWASVGDKIYYAGKDGKAYQGLKDIYGTKYFFNKDYNLAVDQTFIADGGTYQAASDASIKLTEAAKKGWKGLGDKSYYFNDKGNLLRGLNDLGTNRYYFDKVDGVMLRNQIINEGFDKIHTADNGVAHYVGWDYYNGKLGYFNSNGTYSKGLKKIDGLTYGFDNNGKIYNRQYKKIDNQWWYFNKFGEGSKSNGKFPTGWVGDKYYFADGKPAEGIQVINGKTYMFDELTRNVMKNETAVYNHKRYKSDKNGVAKYIGDVIQAPAKTGTLGYFSPGFSKNLNRRTPYFTQNDPRWKNWSYARGTYGNYACGPTAMAMVLNRKLNRNDIYPTTTAVNAVPYIWAWSGTDWQYIQDIPEIYGLKTYEVPVNEKAFIQSLKDNPIIVRVGNGYFINSGHYMVIDSYKDGKFYINDPYYSKKNTMEAHDFWRLKQEVTIAWEIK